MTAARRSHGRTLAATALGAGAAALAVSMLFAGADEGVSLSAYLLAVGAVAVVQLLRWPGASWQIDQRPVAPLAARTPRPDPPARPGGLHELEGLLSEGAFSARAADRRLRPRLSALAEARLLDRRGIHLYDDPERARTALGEQAWPLVVPDSPTPQPISPAAVEILVRRLEEL